MSVINYQYKTLGLIAMLFVVSGHVRWGGIDLAYNLFPPGTFHIAIFVFISAYFFDNTRYEISPGSYVVKKTKTLIIPLLLINACYGILAQILHLYGFTIGAKLSFYSLFVDPFIGGHAFAWCAPLWFIAPLFSTLMVHLTLCIVLKVGSSRIKEAVLISLYLVLGVFAIQYGGTEGLGSGVKLAIGRTFVFLSYFALGRLYKVFLEQRDTTPSLIYFSIVLSLQIILIIVCGEKPWAIPCWLRFGNGGLLSLLLTANGIAFWLRISRHFSPIVERSKALCFAANNTFSIMAHQVLGFLILNSLMLGLSSIGLLDGFSVESFLSNQYYVCEPSFLQQSAYPALYTLYVAAGFIVPLLIHKTWEVTYNFMHTMKAEHV